MLHARRFLFYYVYNILGGIEERWSVKHVLPHYKMRHRCGLFV